MSGQLIDASIVAAPKQRNTDAEKDALKVGKVPEDWADKPAKLRQKDRDARWTMKRGRVQAPPTAAARGRRSWFRPSATRTTSPPTAATA